MFREKERKKDRQAKSHQFCYSAVGLEGNFLTTDVVVWTPLRMTCIFNILKISHFWYFSFQDHKRNGGSCLVNFLQISVEGVGTAFLCNEIMACNFPCVAQVMSHPVSQTHPHLLPPPTQVTIFLVQWLAKEDRTSGPLQA